MKKISVIIPSYNSSITIGKTIGAVLSQSQGELVNEIIIVDSSDDIITKQVIAEFISEKIRIIDLKIKTIPAISRNIGAKTAKGEILAFIDSDAYPAEDWAKNIEEAQRNGCKIGGGSVLLPPFQMHKLIPISQYYIQFNEFMDIGKISKKIFVPSCNLYCDKQLFEIIGGFPEIRAAEDVLFGLKANKFTQIWFIPRIKVYHIFRESLLDYLKNQTILGKYTIIYRKIYFKKLVYKGLLALAILPLFLSLKFIKILLRICRSNRYHIINFIISLPFFMLGLLFLGFGYIEGCFVKLKAKI